MYNNQYMNPYRPTTQSNNIVWVQGIEGAKAYQIPSSSSVMLMDSENDGIFYIKISDNIGMCTLRTFRYEEIVETVPAIDTSNYITKDEFYAEMERLLGGLNNEQTISTVESKTRRTDRNTNVSEQSTANGYDVQRTEKSRHNGSANGKQ